MNKHTKELPKRNVKHTTSYYLKKRSNIINAEKKPANFWKLEKYTIKKRQILKSSKKIS